MPGDIIMFPGEEPCMIREVRGKGLCITHRSGLFELNTPLENLLGLRAALEYANDPQGRLL